MGADMLVASVREYHRRSLTKLNEIIDAFPSEEAARIYRDVEGEEYGNLYSEEGVTVLEHVQEKLREAVSAIRGGSREVTYLEYAGDSYTVILWITGGMSWGDEPTEAFSPFLYLAEAAIL
jgi:hypothetical protein